VSESATLVLRRWETRPVRSQALGVITLFPPPKSEVSKYEMDMSLGRVLDKVVHA
jgi:hypothetical protein